MNFISKLAAAATGLMTVSIVAFGMSPVFAGSPGQLESGPTVYESQDVTQNGSYATTISASSCDEIEYSVQLTNTEFNTLNNIVVSVNLPGTTGTSNTSSVTATPDSGGTTGTNGSTTVNLSSAQSISYVNGSTQLFDGNGNLIKTLPDGVVSQNGINVGSLNGSTTEFVNFEAKVSCPSPTPTTYSATETVSATATATANASANCAKGDVNSVTTASASASATASASESATSTISQADANQKATALAQTAGQSKAQAAAQAQATASAQANATAECTVTPTTPPTQATTTATQAAPVTALPNTGPGDIEGLFVGTSSLGAVGNFLFRRFRR